MTEAELFKLKNGTDVRGTALEVVDDDPVTLTDEAVLLIAKAFCVWTQNQLGKTPTIAIGHDSRLSADRISSLVTAGVTACGGNVILTGLSSSASLFMLLKEYFGSDASVMITA
ncbi:MAG: phosphomannomutase/phosphoglucomutase, partial [Clostridia bacterium]|nr:phosphomannomutase/phosphoglucomutase [Clostridia bacterium]